MMERSVLLEAEAERLAACGAEELRRAEEALDALEESCSPWHAGRFLSESLRWIDGSLAEVFRQEVPANARIVARAATVTAPFSAWRALYPENSLVLIYGEAIREQAIAYGIEARRLVPPRPAPREPRARTACSATSLLITIFHELTEREAALALHRIQSILGLNHTETGELFGVSRQAIAQWRERGVPEARMADVSRVEEIARFLHEKLLPERIPQIVRTDARGLDGRTILEAVSAEGPAVVQEYLHALFAYRAA